jgi:exopolyphosphatase / guanosine-5'-triphosphate,3'-diphosphate pyrophosphatase
VHRWLGWSAGPLPLLDIGGGSLEIAHGRDEDPTLAVSLPLGAGRLTRSQLPKQPASHAQIKVVRRHVREPLRPTAERLRWEARTAQAVATSKTFKQLARLAGTSTGDQRQMWSYRGASADPTESGRGSEGGLYAALRRRR